VHTSGERKGRAATAIAEAVEKEEQEQEQKAEQTPFQLNRNQRKGLTG
jgi:hypothetical protein